VAKDRASVFVVEDEQHTRAHLCRAIEALPDLRLIGAAGSCAEAREAFAKEPPDVLLTDLGLPDGSGISLIREALAIRMDTLAMVITVFGDEKNVLRSIEAGASGYLLKDGTIEDIGASIRQLLDGGSPISPSIARYLLRRFQQPQKKVSDEDKPKLTGRESEVLKLIAKGFSFPEIADLLSISVHTVTTHVRKLYKKLQVNSRGEAVYEALQIGLINPDL
jgi:DNA-binding NarL/FixJ family response regulator